MITVDGNDGLGKTTLVNKLKKYHFDVKDRGLPTELTDLPTESPGFLMYVDCNDCIYIILDGPVELSRERLEKAGRDLNEKYHTVEGLTHYRERFKIVSKIIPNCHVIDATKTPDEIFNEVLELILRI